MKEVFITGGTGYLGSRLIPILVKRGYSVTALVRKGSENKLPAGCKAVIADPFAAADFAKHVPSGCTYVQLLGVHHPGPKKKDLFVTIDLASAKASAEAAVTAGVSQFIYLSVAMTPTRIMQDYQQCRAKAEGLLRESGLPCTFIRPWYIIGPGHYWPLFFSPLFKVLEWIPSTSAKAKALRLVYLDQMLRTLVFAIETPLELLRTIEIQQIRKL
jgi:uncharacterized protein YbjT (DUF2867 family)